MTREDREFAKSRIKYLLLSDNCLDKHDRKSLEMAIEALQEPKTDTWSIKEVSDALERHGLLEQEPCDDAISRQAMHIELEKWITYGEYKYSNATKYLYDRIDRLPLVNPQPKMGRWIGRDASGTNFYGKCSCCGQEIQIDAWFTQNMNYCPNCGAKMIEPQESEE